MTVIEPKQPAHICPLPWKSGGYGSTGLPDGTVFICPGCTTPWWAAPCYESFGPTQKWHRVRWYHWRLRRRIAEADAEVTGA